MEDALGSVMRRRAGIVSVPSDGASDRDRDDRIEVMLPNVLGQPLERRHELRRPRFTIRRVDCLAEVAMRIAQRMADRVGGSHRTTMIGRAELSEGQVEDSALGVARQTSASERKA